MLRGGIACLQPLTIFYFVSYNPIRPECIRQCNAAVPGLAAVEFADTNGGDCFCYGPGFLTWTELVNNSDLTVPKNVYYREPWKETPPTGSC